VPASRSARDHLAPPRHEASPRARGALIALLVSVADRAALLMLIAGVAPGHVWSSMVTRTFGDPYLLGQVLYKATGLALTGSPSRSRSTRGCQHRAEGQLTAGVLACAVTGVALPAGTPAVIAIPLCLVAGGRGGRAVGATIGVLRVTRGAHEVITSIMLNAIVAGVALWIGNEWLFRGGTTTGGKIAAGAELPSSGSAAASVNASLVLAALAVAGCGGCARARRGARRGARSVRIRRRRRASGSPSVVCGSGDDWLGRARRSRRRELRDGPQARVRGGARARHRPARISAALLGRMHPIGVAVAALVLASCRRGLAVADLVPKELTEMLQGVVVLAVAAAGPWVRRQGWAAVIETCSRSRS